MRVSSKFSLNRSIGGAMGAEAQKVLGRAVKLLTEAPLRFSVSIFGA